jgi:superfamily II RNA helicase
MVKLCNHPHNVENKLFSMWDFQLSDFQKYAIDSIIKGNNTIITAHTGSGKTLPAEFLLRHCKDKNKKTIYTTPIKALSNEKFNDLQKKYPEISFGIITGDIKFNPEADVLIMTTECLCNTLYQMKMLKEKTMVAEQLNLLFEMDIENELGGVIFDEIHYINDPDRGHVWEETIMMLPSQVQILGLSATMNKPENFCKWIENIKGKEVWLCPNKKRVVPLKHKGFMTVAKSTYEKFPSNIKNLFEDNKFYENAIMLKDNKFDDTVYEKISRIVKYFKINNIWIDKKFVLNRMTHYLKLNNLLPAIYFVFSQKKTEEFACSISINLFEEGSKIPSTIKDECKKIMMKLPNYREYIQLPEYKKIISLLEKGIAYHHAGVTNVFREMIELLFSKGYIKLLFATETFSVGINMPTRTVVFTSMKKYSNKGFRFLKSHEYTQMSGRAGRRGIDTVGHVFHLINFYAIQENNYPSTQTMREIFSGKPPSIESKFKINPNIILKLLCVGKNNFEEFIESSMVNDLFKKQIKLSNEIIDSLKIKKEKIDNSIQNLRSSKEDLEKYNNLEKNINRESRKKRGKIMREMNLIKEKQKSFNDDYDCYLRGEKISLELIKAESNRSNLETYVQLEVHMILELLINNNFVVANRIEKTQMLTMYNSMEEHEIVYTLTEKGKMASNINELHPLAIGNILDSKILNTLSSIEIACVLSIFTNMKLSENNSVLDKNTLYISKKAINVINKIEDEHKWFYDIQLRQKMEDLQSEYLDNIQYNMCDFINNWWKATDANQCYKLVEQMKLYNVSLGKIIKSILKLNNIVEEIEKAALIQNNFELIEKLREIPVNTLKFIATTQSLYL